MSTREHILSRIETHRPGLGLKVPVTDQDCYLAVFKLEGASETGRIIRGTTTFDRAIGLLREAPRDYKSECLIDLDARDIDSCVFPAYGSGYRLAIDSFARAFDSEDVIFA